MITKEFKEWVKDKVIAFTEGILPGQYVPDWYEANDYNWVVNGTKYQELSIDKSAKILWMYKEEYDKLESPKYCIGLWNEVPKVYEGCWRLFNEKTRIG